MQEFFCYIGCYATILHAKTFTPVRTKVLITWRGFILDEDDEKEIINLELWLSKPDVRYHFKCQHIRDTNELAPRFVNFESGLSF